MTGGVGGFAGVAGLPSSWTVDYDRGRYNAIRRAIDADRRHLLGRRYDEVVGTLGLEGAPWDDVALQREPGMVRLYHFRGFSLELTLERVPKGMTPESPRPWTVDNEEVTRHGVLWLAHQEPALRIDGVASGEERMRRFWRLVEEQTARINAELQRERADSLGSGSRLP